MTCKSGLVKLFYLSASVENLILGRGTVCAEVPFHSFTSSASRELPAIVIARFLETAWLFPEALP